MEILTVECGLQDWSDEAFGHQSSEWKFCLGFAIGLMPSTLKGAGHILQLPCKFARKLVKGSLGGEVCALSEMIDHVSLLHELF